MLCPKCNASEVWDNTQKVAEGWKGPVRKCRDQQCGWVQWPPKGQKVSPGAPQGPQRGPKWTWDALAVLYKRCILIVEPNVVASAERLGVKASVDDVLKGAHSVFIEACKSGVAEPKAKLPKSEPKPVPDDEPEPWEEQQ